MVPSVQQASLTKIGYFLGLVLVTVLYKSGYTHDTLGQDGQDLNGIVKKTSTKLVFFTIAKRTVAILKQTSCLL